MKLYTEIPYDNPECIDQDELIECSKKEFMALFEPAKPGFLLQIFRFITFIIFLGPIKILLTFFSFLLFYILISILPIFKRFFNTNRAFKNWAFSVCRPVVRLALLSLGIVKINVTGKIDEDSRTIIANHLSLIETIAILFECPVSYLAAQDLKKHEIVRKTANVFEIIFVDRSNPNLQISNQLINIANDPSLLPVVVFPEGKVTNGDALVGFRSGAFVSETPVQSIAIRFRQWLCPKNMSLISWNEDNWYLYCYQIYAIPFITLDISILPPLNWKGQNKTPIEKAKDAELQLANALHTKPYSMSNKVLFNKKNDNKDE